uniref:Homeobox and leucine zipper protein Homez n=1 Tax=Geotrypetes seraphini TaxID=260995 RepID=A0A6P8NWR7_GEOSA|nr:homeobox and leucine zipper protein Homez [Geotrypetes seraphini]XP_033780881.1 homeobox and leucine zipper protein Homez [Geotrypetes seraphini]XP_033780882.1 homeobox and leucine zipper protein Homez [Geotrypetes seraphini]XP_033780883.1 homeobox and leucine zipper protein Homez [Geotrypetes seraphini]XP_033780884.1 homeobox and leucine zipper protein Homez [Geotrypetes seraphini]XP_033780885.1 homeobox and leucine zipper protein Homez [Geotrypetes seraphini]
MPPTTRSSGGCPTSSYGLICLPPISEDLQLIWTQAELTSELDENEHLLHTFSYFPYPSLPEIALLCLRYGLQMEKVKAWFMAQRIRCGISWSSEEIEETRARLLYNQDKLHFKQLVSGSCDAGRPPEGGITKEMPGPCGFRKAEQPMSGKVESNLLKTTTNAVSRDDTSRNTLPHTSKRPRPETDCVTRTPLSGVDHHQQHFTMSQPARGISPRPSPANPQKQREQRLPGGYPHSNVQFSVLHREGGSLQQQIPDSRLGTWDIHTPPIQRQQAPSGRRLHGIGNLFGVDGTEVSAAIACLPSEEELQRRFEVGSWGADFLLPSAARQGPDWGWRSDETFFPVTRRQRKTKEQLAILKSFFLQCQWARREDYCKLEELTGLPRPEIIQWFGDTRYALKHGQLKWFRDHVEGCPTWLGQEQQTIRSGDRGRGESGKEGSPDLPTPMLRPVHNGRQEEKSLLAGISGQSLLQPDYRILEQYWATHRQIQEGDIIRLSRASGLEPQQVMDWFFHKSSTPAEVEVCLDEEDEEEEVEEEEDDDVIIQD